MSTIRRQPELLPGLTRILLPYRRCFSLSGGFFITGKITANKVVDSLLATLAQSPGKGQTVYFTRQAIHKLEAFEEGCR